MVDESVDVGRSIQRTVDAIWLRLDAPDLEPAPGRRGEAALLASATQLGERLEHEALAELDELREKLAEDPAQVESYEVSLAYCAATIAGLRFLGGETEAAKAELKGSASLAPAGEIADLLTEGAADPESFLVLLHAQWLMRKGGIAAGRARALELLRRNPGPELTRCARHITDQLEPLGAAPALFRVNGCGVGLYGSREQRDDGSYETTRYLCVLWVPVFPLDAFRVSREDGGYRFYGKVPLGSGARWVRRLVGGLVLAGGVAGGGYAYLKSDRHQLNVRVEESARLEHAARDPKAIETALASYEQIFQDYEDKVDASRLEPVALGVARVSALTVPEPLTPVGVDTALAALRRFSSLPTGSQGGQAVAFVRTRAESWAKALGSADTERATGSLRLLGVANVALEDPAPLAERERALYLQLGRDLIATWPVVALEFFAHAAAEPGAPAAMDQALAGLPQSSLESLSPILEDWVDLHGSKPAFAKSAARLAEVRKLAEARKQEPGRAELLEKGSDEALESARLAHPDDPAYSVALAERLQGRGESAQALAVLERLGKPGQLSESAALAFGRIARELDKPQLAEEVYEHWLLVRLPAYEATAFKLTRRANAKRHSLYVAANDGSLPVDIKSRLNATTSDEESHSLFSDYVDGELDKDSTIKQLQMRLERLDAVVPAALSLGMLLLEQAQAAPGDAKTRALSKAERTFLSVQSAGEGLPSYHLGLGSVYYRLGKSTEGEQELEALRARKDPKLDLAVARTYRELGQRARAQTAAQHVYETGDDSTKKDAAILMALLASQLEEREKWLLLADQSSSYVKTSLIDVQADRAFRVGDLALADQKYQRVYELYLNESSGDSGSNNAALALASRYECTGDARHLTHAVSLLEKARHGDPSDAVVLQNLAAPLTHLAELDALHTWLDLPTLKLSLDDLNNVIDWLDAGDARTPVLSSLRQSPHLRRASDATRQARVLGPSWPSPYLNELRWLSRFEDEAGLATLQQFAKNAERIDLDASPRDVEDFLSGASDARSREAYQGSIARCEAKLLQLTNHTGPTVGPSRAVLHALWADDEDSLAIIDPDPAHAEKALSLLRQAQGEWPALSLEGDIASNLARLAINRVIGDASPEVRRALRRDGVTPTLWRWIKAPSSPELAAIKAQPEIATAASAMAAAPDRRLGALAFTLGTLAGNADLVRRARAQLALRHEQLSSEIAAIVRGTDEARARLAMTRDMVGPPL